MDFYRQHILPQLINVAMRNQQVTRYREQVIPQARGRVLEVGIGSGLNLPFYGPAVTQLFGLEPSPQLLQMTRGRAGASTFPVQLMQGSAEEIPLEDRTADTIVTTWTMCSIPDVDRALAEMRRVLKPGGEFLFVEHGLAPDPGVRRWQHRLNPIWQRIGGGCNLDRRIDDLIRHAGFRIRALETGYAKGPKPLAFMYRGWAVPV